MAASVPAPPQVPAPPAPAPPRDRILGVDMARGLAILGMVMVHFGPYDPDTSTLGGALYRSTHGRASVLFVLLAGVGVSLLFASRPPRDARIRIGWRVVVFLPLGLALQALPTPVAVILHFYAVYYLLGGLLGTLPTRWLALVTAVWTAAGPLLFLAIADPSLGARGDGASLDDPVGMLGDLLLTGYYPLLTWAPPLLVGMLIGRTDLRDRVTRWSLLVAGAVVVVAAHGGAAVLAAAVDVPGEATRWLSTEAHSGAPLNVLGATGVAVAVLAGCLLLASWAPRATWPLVAFGQMALTVYVGHLLLLAGWPELLEDRFDVGGAAVKVARFAVVAIAGCTLWRWRISRGPIEALVAAPFRWWDGRPAPPR